MRNGRWAIVGNDNHERHDVSNENLKLRTKQFALRVIKLVENLPHDITSSVLGRQLLRAGTSVGANYGAVCRSKSAADFISKMGTVEEEADESGYWLDMLIPLTPAASFSRNRLGLCEPPSPITFGMRPSGSSGG